MIQQRNQYNNCTYLRNYQTDLKHVYLITQVNNFFFHFFHLNRLSLFIREKYRIHIEMLA
nr:MAG TPA: hypothetical protein [Caudoviricetes sp.]